MGKAFALANSPDRVVSVQTVDVTSHADTLQRMTSRMHDLIAHCTDRKLEQSESPLLTQLVSGVEETTQRCETVLRAAEGESTASDIAFTLTQTIDQCAREIAFLQEFALRLPIRPLQDGVNVLQTMHTELTDHELTLFSEMRTAGIQETDITRAMQGLSERRRLSARYGTDRMFRYYLLYLQEMQKFSESPADSWAVIPSGIRSMDGEKYAYQRGQQCDEPVLRAYRPGMNGWFQELDFKTGLWRNTEPEPLLVRVSPKMYERACEADTAYRFAPVSNNEIEAILKGDIFTEAPEGFMYPPALDFLKEYRRLSGQRTMDSERFIFQ